MQQITTADVVYKRSPPAGHQEIRPSRVLVYLIVMHTFLIIFLIFSLGLGPNVEPKTLYRKLQFRPLWQLCGYKLLIAKKLGNYSKR